MAQLVVCVCMVCFSFFSVFFSFVHWKPSGFSVLDCWFERRLDWERWLEIVP